MGRMFFIIWDPRDGEPQRDNGVITSDGIIGRVTEENVYIKAYASISEGEKRPEDLEVGAHTYAEFSLSGSKGLYRIYRVA